MKRLGQWHIVQGMVLSLAFSLTACEAIGFSVSTNNATDPNLKVAFIGDSGSGADFRNVLRLIKKQGAQMVLHQGDLGYWDSSAADFMNAVNDILGPDLPYFASRGNHDRNWEGDYQPILAQRAKEVGALCSGDYGQNAACKFRGLFFILSGGGEKGSEHENTRYIEEQLASDNSIWRICSWHHNQQQMQIGVKSNDVGWGPYEACREGGAIIATGHAHSYARTRTLTSAEKLNVDPDCDTPAGDVVCVTPQDEAAGEAGSTFVVVSGLGGRSIRSQRRCTPTTFPYGQGPACKGIWASIYSSSQAAKYGALFITFNIGGDPTKAEGKFVNIDGDLIDSFTITATSRLAPSSQTIHR
jgi:hypothetical protein